MAKSFYSDLAPLKFEKSLIYPTDLGGNFYPDCVCFTIQKRTGVSIDDVTGAVGAGLGAGQKTFLGQASMKTGEIPEELEKAIAKVKDEPDEKKRQTGIQTAIDTYKKNHENHNLPENMFDVIKKSLSAFSSSMTAHQTKALQMGKSGANILGSIYLNMPNGIQFNESANWAGTELGFMGKMSKDLVSGQGGIGQTAVGALAGGAGSLVGAATGALTVIDGAISRINGVRAELGATQNRFQSTVRNLSTIAENVTAARSQVNDTDYATATAELTKHQIIQQASASVLSQANQLPQAALTLLG